MTDRPIIFSTPMVRALLDGRKTMTRRLAWRMDCGNRVQWRASPWQKVNPGDRLWVREKHVLRPPGHVGYGLVSKVPYARYWANENEPREKYFPRGGWRPSIHMPRWASRLTLVVTAVKIEPLKNINDADAKAEGIYLPGSHELYTHDPAVRANNMNGRTPAGAFQNLWCAINGKDSWDANPEVVALTFTVHKANIDAPSDKRTKE